ncbi:MAG: hypothetical protein PHE89_07650 [Alphaproteobacteria bacterium]|nr:hypothetical protein [Alphaproteobacteria bacterium]
MGLTVLITGEPATAQVCQKQPTCEELGYAKALTDCPDTALKCPTDQTKVFCAKEETKEGFIVENVARFAYYGGNDSFAKTANGQCITLSLFRSSTGKTNIINKNLTTVDIYSLVFGNADVSTTIAECQNILSNIFYYGKTTTLFCKYVDSLSGNTISVTDCYVLE